jgi:hypothetical protein
VTAHSGNGPRLTDGITAAQPASARDAAKVAAYVADHAIWAPSVHNTQPWHFTADSGGLSLYADRGRQLTVCDPDGREMVMSCGAALFTARLALRSLGYVPDVDIFPDESNPLLIARLTWPQAAPPADYERRMFGQIMTRRTHRGGFDPLPLSAGLLTVLQAGAVRDGAMLQVMSGEPATAELAAIVRAADEVMRVDTRYRQELSAWAPPPGSLRADGVLPMAYPARPEHTVPDFPSRDFAHGLGWGSARFGSPAANRWPGVACVLTTRQDRARDWVSAGQALQRILLTSASCGVAAALHSEPAEVAGTRQQLRSQLCGGHYPQLVIRLGTVIQTSVGVRRPLSSVLSFAGRRTTARNR